MIKHDGGAAFPVDCNTPPDCESAGMRLRDYFAAKAMQAMITGMFTSGAIKNLKPQELAGAAYEWADFMIKARGAGNG